MSTFDDAKRRISACRKSGSDTLDLSRMDLTSIPAELSSLKNVVRLVLSYNSLTGIPDGAFALSKLKVLEIDHNRVESIPDKITRLTELHYLDLESNKLTSIPAALGELTSLTTLYLHRNRIDTVPSALGKLQQLIDLDLGQNQLSRLPKSISSLKNLRYLNIGTNTFQNLPEWLPELTNLEVLYLDNNPFKSLPKGFEALTKLISLTLGGTDLPPEVQSLSPDRLLSYLGEQKMGTTDLNEIKLVVMGNGGSGKTQLLRRLRGLPFKATDSTHAFDIEQNPLELKGPAGTLCFNCWDFGGQEKYEIMHQLFISPRNVFIVVWNPRFDTSFLQSWLELIQQRAGSEAPIIVVATFREGGLHAPNCDEENLVKRFPGIKGFFWVSNLTDEALVKESKGDPEVILEESESSLSQIRELLVEEGAKRTLKAFPLVRSRARDRIVGLEELLVKIAELRDLCPELDGDQLPSLLIQLESVGDLIFHDDPILADENMVVLEPQWLGKAIGYAINLKGLATENGELQLHDLYRAWDESADREGYRPDHYPYFLWLMDKFQVALPLPEGRLLVPQFISSRRPHGLEFYPESEAVSHKQCAFVFKFRSVPPNGLIPILTCALSGLCHEEHPYHMWREGFAFCMKHGQRVYIELRDRLLLICARSEYPSSARQSITSIIRNQLDGHWPGAEYVEYVPCQQCLISREPEGLIPASFLGHLDAPPTVQCQTCMTIYQTNDLDTGSTISFERGQMATEISRFLEKANEHTAKLEEALAYTRKIALGHCNVPTNLALVKLKGGLKDFGYEVYELQVYCDCIDHGPEPVRRYKVKVLSQFAQAVAKLARVGYVLTAAAKGGVAAASLMDSTSAFATELSTVKTITDLTGVTLTNDVEDSATVDSDPMSAGAGFLFLGRLLMHIAPDGKWGVEVEVGHSTVRWVCPEHYRSLV